jgi:hypothetical protein
MRRALMEVLRPCVLLVVLAGCPQKTAVWVGEGSTASKLAFRIAASRGGSDGVEIGVVRVEPCSGTGTGGGAAWVIGPKVGTARFSRVEYGSAPHGFVTEQGPIPLAPGCYRVIVSGTGRAEFQVSSDGSVSENRPG